MYPIDRKIAISRVLSMTIINKVLNMPRPDTMMIVETVIAAETLSVLKSCNQDFSRCCHGAVK